MTPPKKSVLITGANTGLGKELARQLALRADFDMIYLACRNPTKAAAAQQDLTAVTGRTSIRCVRRFPRFIVRWTRLS
jgi:NAD(P)-dependent dehydrogenase (short-subunit alcohol dehydrogenase family)